MLGGFAGGFGLSGLLGAGTGFFRRRGFRPAACVEVGGFGVSFFGG